MAPSRSGTRPREPLQTRSFILRVWQEPVGGGEESPAVLWRGELREVVSGRKAFFGRLEALPAALSRLLLDPRDPTG